MVRSTALGLGNGLRPKNWQLGKLLTNLRKSELEGSKLGETATLAIFVFSQVFQEF